MNKAVGGIVILIGLYELLATFLVDKIPGVLTDVYWGWVIGIVVVLIGLWLLKQQ